MCESVCRLVVLNVYSLVVWVGGVHHPIVCTYICMYVHTVCMKTPGWLLWCEDWCSRTSGEEDS